MQKQAPYMSTGEFSNATGIPVKKITAWLRQGTLKGTKQAGKWLIASDQVSCVPAISHDAEPGPAAQPATTGASYSVSEFSAMTYLTPFGVSEWLKKGILSGCRDADGNWRVDAGNLESERIKRLRRC
jgi:predicted site-specific integrase-resolvase